jgi:hypothetical protein
MVNKGAKMISTASIVRKMRLVVAAMVVTVLHTLIANAQVAPFSGRVTAELHSPSGCSDSAAPGLCITKADITVGPVTTVDLTAHSAGAPNPAVDGTHCRVTGDVVMNTGTHVQIKFVLDYPSPSRLSRFDKAPRLLDLVIGNGTAAVKFLTPDGTVRLEGEGRLSTGQ